MEDNFFASVMRSQEQIQVCLDTPMIPAKASKAKNEESITTSTSTTVVNDDILSSEVDGESKRSVSVSKAGSLVIPDDSSIYDDAYIVNVTGTTLVKKPSSSSSLMGKKPHIEYILTVSRIADGVTQVIQKRFREIKAFYQEVTLHNLPFIALIHSLHCLIDGITL